MKIGKLKAITLTLLFSALFMAGCSGGNAPGGGEEVKTTPDALAGKLLILQAYGTGGTGTAASHSFVELYNTTDSAINLDGYSLYYADGSSSNSNGTRPLVDGDAPWTRVDLSGKSIPAGGSLLVLGAEKVAADTPGLDLTGKADVTAAGMLLNNRAFKVAIIKSNGALTEVNPFDTGSGETVNGYVDMVGGRNTVGTDSIEGFESDPTRISASAGARRVSLVDTDDNSEDFEEARYNEMSAEELELLGPRNIAAGKWDPFPASGGEEEPEPYTPLAPPTLNVEDQKLLILQAYGTGTGGDGATNSFVELYNSTDEDIDLATDGYVLWYANGIRGLNESADEAWKSFALTGTVGAGESFLILGPQQGAGGRLKLNDDYDTDMNDPNLVLSNRSFKVVLIKGATSLTGIANPFDTDGSGTTVSGYVDMVGAANDLSNSNPDNIYGYETAPARNSGSAAVRRAVLIDTDNNSVDFASIDYRTSGTSAAELEIYRPKSTDYGPWDPNDGATQVAPATPTFYNISINASIEDGTVTANYTKAAAGTVVILTITPDEGFRLKSVTLSAGGTVNATTHRFTMPTSDVTVNAVFEEIPEGSETLLILQANPAGNNNGGAGGFPFGLVELYNLTDAAINLSADGGYYLHIGTTSSNAEAWTYVITLTGTIPAKSSYLVVSTTDINTNADTGRTGWGRAVLPSADQSEAFAIANDGFKVALLQGQSTTLTVANPFNTDGDGTKIAGYIDMLGAGDANSVATAEGTRVRQSRPQPPRRTSLVDTNDNSLDFAQWDARGIISGGNGIADSELYKYWPRNSTAGAWDPIAGTPVLNPTLNPSN